MREIFKSQGSPNNHVDHIIQESSIKKLKKKKLKIKASITKIKISLNNRKKQAKQHQMNKIFKKSLKNKNKK